MPETPDPLLGFDPAQDSVLEDPLRTAREDFDPLLGDDLDTVIIGRQTDDPLAPLRQHAQANIAAGMIAHDDKGRPATVRSGSVENPNLNNGKPTLIPFQWDGKIVDQREAERRAIKSGISWPSFETNAEADAASRKLSASIRIP